MEERGSRGTKGDSGAAHKISQMNCDLWELTNNRFICGDERDPEILRQRDELAIEAPTDRSLDQSQNGRRSNTVFPPPKQAFCFVHQFSDSRDGKDFRAKMIGEDISEFGSPEKRSAPCVHSSCPLSEVTELRGYEKVADDVRIDDDHGRPHFFASRIKSSLTGGIFKVERNSSISSRRRSRSSVLPRDISRRCNTSPLRLRLLAFARALIFRCIFGGISMIVIFMAESGTILVPLSITTTSFLPRWQMRVKSCGP